MDLSNAIFLADVQNELLSIENTSIFPLYRAEQTSIFIRAGPLSVPCDFHNSHANVETWHLKAQPYKG